MNSVVKNFLQFVKSNNGPRPLEKFESTTQRIRFKCPEGHKFEATPVSVRDRMQNGVNYCPTCIEIRRTFDKDAYNVSIKPFKLIGEYVNSKTRVEHECPKGHRFEAFARRGTQPTCLKCPTEKQNFVIENLKACCEHKNLAVTAVEREGNTGLVASYLCKVCGHAWAGGVSHLRDAKCRECELEAKAKQKQERQQRRRGDRNFSVTPARISPKDLPSLKRVDAATLAQKVKELIKLKFGGAISYRETEYAPVKQKFACRECGNKWLATARDVLHCKKGCPECGRKQASEKMRMSHAEYELRVYELYEGRLRPLDKYAGYNCRLRHECACGHIAELISTRVLKGTYTCRVCTKASSGAYSMVSQVWLAGIASIRKYDDLVYATKGGEHIIDLNGTRMKVDGYSASTNTVFEFLGDCFHGKGRSAVPGKTRKELLKSTLVRFMKLNLAGYSVYYVWESDFPNKSFSGCFL